VSQLGQSVGFDSGAANGRLRRYLAVTWRSGEVRLATQLSRPPIRWERSLQGQERFPARRL